MKSATAANVLGALAQAIGDSVGTDTAAAALVHLSKYPDGSIDALRRPLGLATRAASDWWIASRPSAWSSAESPRIDGVRALRLTRSGGAAARRVLAARAEALLRVIARLSANEREALVRIATKILAELVVDAGSALSVCRLCDYASCPDEAVSQRQGVGGARAGR